jgi:twitching motility protein PilT
MNIFDIMELIIQKNGSDIHLITKSPPMLRVHGELESVEGLTALTAEQAQMLIDPLMTKEQKDYVKVNKEIDFGYQYQDKGRFRINVYHQQGEIAAALRLIPAEIKTISDLMLPEIFHSFTKYKQGLILITGPTGEGKSTTLAALIEEINMTRGEHILTIEDPVEFIYQPKRSIISQREINRDTHSWSVSLRSALREDPDVVLVGEMRDFETISAALTVAETGHLVFGTLHTSSAAQTIDRIIDVFPASQQNQIRQQLAASLQAVVSQRLVPVTSGGRMAATEVMVAIPSVRNLIREEKIFQIDNIIQTSGEHGMMLMETSLLNMVQRGAVSKEVAIAYSFRPQEMKRLLGM